MLNLPLFIVALGCLTSLMVAVAWGLIRIATHTNRSRRGSLSVWPKDPPEAGTSLVPASVAARYLAPHFPAIARPFVPLVLRDNARLHPELRPRLSPGGGRGAAVILCPGGSYVSRVDSREGEPVARWLNSQGISAFILAYRTAPFQEPAAFQDISRAIRLLRSRARDFGIDPGRIGVMGFSAGGHLASSLITRFDGGDPSSPDPVERLSSRPDFAVLCYPVISMRSGVTHQLSRDVLLGPSPSAELIDAWSSELWVRDDTPPVFLWTTETDEDVPAENSKLFAAALAAKSIPHTFLLYPSGRHGLGLARRERGVREWPSHLLAWLDHGGF